MNFLDFFGFSFEFPKDLLIYNFSSSVAEEFDQGAHNYAPKPTPSTSKKAQKIVYPSKQQKARKKITPRKPVHVPEPKKKAQPLEERFPITDARKPFVCQNCGVCFTRQKALESHSKVSFAKKKGNKKD